MWEFVPKGFVVWSREDRTLHLKPIPEVTEGGEAECGPEEGGPRASDGQGRGRPPAEGLAGQTHIVGNR